MNADDHSVRTENMIRAVTMYQVVCDACGYVDNEGDYAAWSDIASAEEVAHASDWVLRDSKHYCPKDWPHDS